MNATDPGDGGSATLAEVVASHGLAIDAERLEWLDAYRATLWAWNERLNLTRHTTLEKFVARDLFDTLRLADLIDEGHAVLDIGSGGGVPGLPLAVLRPDLKVSVCDSVAKKANALGAIVEELELPVTVFAGRAEHLVAEGSPAPRFDTLVARAVAPMWKFLFWLKPHRDRFDELLLIKGPAWVEERGEARHRGLMKGFELRRAATYVTPGTDAETTVLSLTPRV
ncbi:MAG: 16S rRNA (guanine(527)-N(7))-methyltransferase RsmG [Planctomycetota bacterium]